MGFGSVEEHSEYDLHSRVAEEAFSSSKVALCPAESQLQVVCTVESSPWKEVDQLKSNMTRLEEQFEPEA